MGKGSATRRYTDEVRAVLGRPAPLLDLVTARHLYSRPAAGQDERRTTAHLNTAHECVASLDRRLIGDQRADPEAGSRSESGTDRRPGARLMMYKSNLILYNTLMSTMNVSEAREKLAEAIDAAQSEAVVLERYGRPAAVLVSMERYEQLLEALEEAEDITAFDAAMAEAGDNIPWDKVKADLGWS